MASIVSEEMLRSAISSLIDVRHSNLGCEVQLPVIYPNGDLVSVTVTTDRGDYIVHDAGSGTMILNANGLQITKAIAQRLDKIAAHFGCEFLSGRVSRKCSIEDIAITVTIVANVSRSVGDQLMLQDNKPILDFRRDVLERIRDTVGSSRYRENEEVFGETGSAYRISAVILNSDQSKPISFIEPVKDREAATKKFRQFWDISRAQAYTNVQRVSMYDDKRAWASGDLLLLQEVSNVVRVSDAQQRMMQLLTL